MRIWALALGNLGSMLRGLSFRGLSVRVLGFRGLNFRSLGFRSLSHENSNFRGLDFEFPKYLNSRCPNLIGLGLII